MVRVAIEKPESDIIPSAPVRRRSRWRLKLLGISLITFAVGPSILSLTGQVPAVLQKLHPKLAEAIVFRSITLHWWAPVEVTAFRVFDLSEPLARVAGSDPPVLCEADRIITAEPLWRILLNGGRGTGITVESPKLNLITGENGTNIDRTLTAVFGESISTSTDRFPIRITVENGIVELNSAAQPNVSGATRSSVSSATDDGRNGRLVPAAMDSASAIVTEINGQFSSMDTERWLPEMKLTASITRRAGDSSRKDAATSRQSVTRPTRLAAGLNDVAADFPSIPLEELAGTAESGDATEARIQIRLQPRADDKGRQTIQIGARDVDLRLVQPFLSMLGLATSCEGTISGGIDARLAGATLKDGLVGRLLLQGSDIKLRQLGWAAEEWLVLGTVGASGAVAIADDGMLIQNLDIQTDVADLRGSGELRHDLTSTPAAAHDSETVELNGTVDLARVAESLRKTLGLYDDLTIQRGQLTFAVRGSAKPAIHLGRTPGGLGADTPEFVASVVNIDAASSRAGHGSWQFTARTEGLEAVRGGKPLEVDTGMRMDAAGPFIRGVPELLEARLTAKFGTIDCIPDGDAWKLSGLLQPESLWRQLQQFADVQQPGLKGEMSFQSRVSMKDDVIQLTETHLTSSDVKLSSVALELTPSNSFTSMLDGTIHVEGSGAAIRTLLAPWHDASWLAEGSRVVSDLTASLKREIRLTARVTPENVAALRRSSVLSVSRSHGAPGLTATPGAGASAFAIDEAEVALTLTAANAARQFEISNGMIRIPGLTALVTGSISVPEGATILDLTADTTYDLDLLSRRLFTADSGLSFSGNGRDTFKLTGSPSAVSGMVQRAATSKVPPQLPLSLQGEGTIHWTSAQIEGLQLGEASVRATLENRRLRSIPIQCTLNGGELNVMPQYDLDAAQWQLGSGSRMQHVQLSPELCRTWIGYVAPMLADTAEVSGQISARVERFLWDVNVPENSDVLAQLTIHNAQAAPGPSLAPLLEIIDLLRRRDRGAGLADRSLTLPEQTVPVQVRQGYVVHEGLIMDLAGYRLKTSGAVGMDQQLQITLDLPLEKHVDAENVRTIKIPLRGSVTHPEPDTAALLQNLGTQQIQEKVGEQVDKALNKQLNKLLDKF